MGRQSVISMMMMVSTLRHWLRVSAAKAFRRTTTIMHAILYALVHGTRKLDPRMNTRMIILPKDMSVDRSSFPRSKRADQARKMLQAKLLLTQIAVGQSVLTKRTIEPWIGTDMHLTIRRDPSI